MTYYLLDVNSRIKDHLFSLFLSEGWSNLLLIASSLRETVEEKAYLFFKLLMGEDRGYMKKQYVSLYSIKVRPIK